MGHRLRGQPVLRQSEHGQVKETERRALGKAAQALLSCLGKENFEIALKMGILHSSSTN